MIKDSDIISLSQFNKESLLNGKKGIEREMLRLDKENSISQDSHKKYLGSALCNNYITTDFSEAQLEIVTMPYHEIGSLFTFLKDAHHFITHSISDEKLWPFSMPPDFSNEDNIPIAHYGTSNLALFKETYRNGLSKRYGKAMQAISGLHFNYSLSDEIWKYNLLETKDFDKKKNKEVVYFRAIRNISRMNWLILYLFGASPIFSKSFLSKPHDSDKYYSYMDSLYLPYATSLRMSDLGYQNFSQSNIKVSLNSLDSYIYDLYRATNVDDTNFNFQPKSSNYFQQLNTNQLQIEDEFYAVSRPKNSVVSDARITSKLKMFGVDYVELRSVDIDPFSSIGIEQSTAKFLEAFVMFCAFSPSPLLNNNDIEAIRKNDLLVAREGRKPDLELINNNQGIKLKTWAIQILESMELFFDVFDIDTKIYKERVENPENTISAKFLSSIMSSNMDLNEFAIDISNENKESFLRIKKEENKKWNMLEKEVIDSKAKQAKLEKNESIKFYQFLENYFNS